MKTSDQLAKLSKALVTALGAVTGVTKDSKNPHFKNDYASLEAVTEMARPVLAANGLCVVQSPGVFEGNRIPVTTRIIHESGEWIEGEIVIPLSKVDAQGAGSAVTYARRYALMAMLGVAPVDDDGEAAVQRVPANSQCFITEDQAATIQALVEDVGADMPKFLAYLKVPSINKIPSGLYESAVAKLNAKRAA